ncbi:TolC family protein [Flavobacterium kingsejongi]|uniref:Transporter n=1 Tax=Flavobacterium kingsejongi TaxID=1678728 RepID=A0A2S1LPT5_9FLAO|nr:TolC family protein [Flavobacterium kingsejongi]AWG25672.1 transporter [Flavobacterium kingsejongi]
MKMKIFLRTLIILVFAVVKTNAQDLLTVENAVKIALENNYEIRVSANDLKVDEQNVSIGNAGMLPILQATISDNKSHQNTTQTRLDGTVNTLNNAQNNSLNYGVGLDWTIFDGFRMFALHDQLKELKKVGEAELKLTILTKVSSVITTYYDLVQQKQQLTAMDTAIAISEQRLMTAENRYKIGKASKLEVLNAKVDINTDTTNLLRQKELNANTKILLNQILARDPNTPFHVMDSIVMENVLILPDLVELAQEQNPQLQIAQMNKRVLELELKQVKANRYPTVSVNTGYNFAESQSSLGFTTQSSSKGFNYGFSASLNLFDGFNQRRNEKVAALMIQNSQLTYEQQTQAITTQLSTAYQTYLTNLLLIEVEKKNEEIAKENLDITMAKFKIGTITPIEFRTAQLNYVNARVRNSNAQYLAKLSEITLKELAGNLKLE